MLGREKVIYFYIALILLTAIVMISALSVVPLSEQDKNYFAISAVRNGISWDAFLWSFSSPYYGFWQPLTWISHAIDFSIYGGDLFHHRITSLFLHILTSCLLFRFLYRTTEQALHSLIAAMIFAIHPIQAEALTDFTARGAVLAAPLVVTMMLCQVSNSIRFSHVRYITMLILFLMIMLIEPAYLALPFVLILLTYWPALEFKLKMSMKRDSDTVSWKTVFGQKAIDSQLPFLALSIIVGFFSFMIASAWCEAAGVATPSLLHIIFDATGWSLLYFARTLGPLITASYVNTPQVLPLIVDLIALVILVCIGIFLAKRTRHERFWFFGMLSFLAFLAPFIVFNALAGRVGSDSVMYMAIFPTAVMFSWGGASLIKKR